MTKTGNQISGMNRSRTIISYMVALLSVSTAVLSCSVEAPVQNPDAMEPYKERSILVTGSVSDMDGKALEDVTITLKAYPQNDAGASPVTSETTYTSNKGTYSIHAKGSDMQLMCVITAEDMSGVYESLTQQVIISWKGMAFDEYTNMFIVNDCNFKLNKR